MANYTLTFPTLSDAQDYFRALSFRKLPVKGAPILSANGYSDDGTRIITFARGHLSNPLVYTFTEKPAR